MGVEVSGVYAALENNVPFQPVGSHTALSFFRFNADHLQMPIFTTTDPFSQNYKCQKYYIHPVPTKKKGEFTELELWKFMQRILLYRVFITHSALQIWRDQ